MGGPWGTHATAVNCNPGFPGVITSTTHSHYPPREQGLPLLIRLKPRRKKKTELTTQATLRWALSANGASLMYSTRSLATTLCHTVINHLSTSTRNKKSAPLFSCASEGCLVHCSETPPGTSCAVGHSAQARAAWNRRGRQYPCRFRLQ